MKQGRTSSCKTERFEKVSRLRRWLGSRCREKMVTVQSGECVGRRLVYNGFRGHKQPGDITHPEMSLSFSLHKMVLVTWHQYFWGTKTYHHRTADYHHHYNLKWKSEHSSSSPGCPLESKASVRECLLPLNMSALARLCTQLNDDHAGHSECWSL